MDDRCQAARHWSSRLREFIPRFFEQSPALHSLIGKCAIILHGSTTLGMDDAFSDLDLWVLAPIAELQRAEAVAATRFVSFELEGKKGHFNLEPAGEMLERVGRCDLELIAELRRCDVLFDFDEIAGQLASLAKRPMSDAVRRAWFCYHYIEMRGFHRNCDNPIERGQSMAVLQALVPTLNHALRAAMVLDCEPYPYIKWLANAARETPTGRRLTPLMDDVLQLLAADALRHPGPESTHPLSLKLREIRQILIQCARASGIDEPWLDRWWVHMTQAADGIRSMVW